MESPDDQTASKNTELPIRLSSYGVQHIFTLSSYSASKLLKSSEDADNTSCDSEHFFLFSHSFEPEFLADVRKTELVCFASETERLISVESQQLQN